MITNRVLSAAEAAAVGIWSPRSFPDVRTGRQASTELAARVASGASHSHAAVKKLLLTTFGSGLEEQMELERQD